MMDDNNDEMMRMREIIYSVDLLKQVVNARHCSSLKTMHAD